MMFKKILKVRLKLILSDFLKLILINFWSEEAKETSFLYYFYILSGPFVACFVGIFFCLVPMPNVLQQPSRWYEEILTRMYSGIPVIVCQILHQAELWTYFTFEKRWQTYLLVMGLTYHSGIFKVEFWVIFLQLLWWLFSENRE